MMRTTLTLDDDVAAALERLRRSRDASLKDLVNEALRRGLIDMGRRTKSRERVSTRVADLVACVSPVWITLPKRSPSSKASSDTD